MRETPGIRERPHCILFLGGTIGNYSRENAATFLRNIAENTLLKKDNLSAGKQSSILISIDSCKVPTQVLRAYTAEGVVPFALEALRYGNTLFAREGAQSKISATDVFDPSEWYFQSEWNYVLGRHEASLIPRSKNIRLGGSLEGIVVDKNEKVRFGCSYKYDRQERDGLLQKAGLKVKASWSDDDLDLEFFGLE